MAYQAGRPQVPTAAADNFRAPSILQTPSPEQENLTWTSVSSETRRYTQSGNEASGDLEKSTQEESRHAGDTTNLVDWDGPQDPKNPMNWTNLHKWTIISLVSAITFNLAMASTIFAPGVPLAMKEFHSTNSAESSLLVSVYVIGLAIGPLLLSPLSKVYGRNPVMHIANLVFLVATVLCAVSVNLPMLIIFRLVMGLACCIPVTLGGGFVADLMAREERGTALSLWAIGPLLGPVIGPVSGGYLTLKLGWRWTFWLIAILAGVLTIASLILLKETYGPRLLQKKTWKLREETGNQALKSKFDNGKTPGELIKAAAIRPTKMLFCSPIILILSMFVSIVYSYMYLLFTTFTSVFEVQYGFNSGEAGLAYLGLGIGFCIGQFSVSVFSDRYIARQGAEVKPEYRLPPLVAGAFLVPMGLFWYGWAVAYHAHWAVPIVGTGLVGIGILYVFFPVQMYLVDAYTIFAASAIGANTVVRSVFGTCIPLAGPALYAKLGLGWGNSVLGFIALAFAPTSLLLVKYGERIRSNPKFQPKL